jgi:DNA topoisomerase-2
MLNPITRFVFPDADDAVLKYLDDDGTLVEPEHYVPIIPFALVNGIRGIGTGFSCSVPPYNPRDLIAYVRALLRGTAPVELTPYYEGFRGTIAKIEADKYLIKGRYERTGPDTVTITELPVGRWTMPYTKVLEEMMDGGVDKDGKKVVPQIKDFTSLCTEVGINICVVLPKGRVDELIAQKDANGIDGIEKLLKLTTTVKTSNIHMFNGEGKLTKYENTDELIRDYYGVRLAAYGVRKAHLLADMTKKAALLSSRAKYIEYTLTDKIDLRRKSAEAVVKTLADSGFEPMDGDYKYLVKMPMDSVTAENVERLRKERDDMMKELDVLTRTTPEQIWLHELEQLETKYGEYKKVREQIQNAEPTPQKKVVKVVRKVKADGK